jgi:hypothetical protein
MGYSATGQFALKHFPEPLRRSRYFLQKYNLLPRAGKISVSSNCREPSVCRSTCYRICNTTRLGIIMFERILPHYFHTALLILPRWMKSESRALLNKVQRGNTRADVAVLVRSHLISSSLSSSYPGHASRQDDPHVTPVHMG